MFCAPFPPEHSPSSIGSSKANVTDIFFLGLNLRPSFCTIRTWGEKSVGVQEFKDCPWVVTLKEPFTCRIGFRGLASMARCPKCCLLSKCCLFSKFCLFSLDITILVEKLGKFERTKQ